MTEVMNRLIRYLVSCARAFELDAEEILALDQPPRTQGSYAHENYKYGAHVCLVLYTHEHPANPYFGKPETLELCCRQADTWLTEWEGTGCGFAEWPPLMICRALDLLGDEIEPDRRERWERFVAWFVEEDIPKPFFFTAPNHEAWRLAVTALAGRLFDRPQWLELATFQTKQLIKYQNSEGFWDEGRHHGPSMKYNALQLGAMAVVTEETGDDVIRTATARLANFMARWSFPDGVTVGAFDGRQSTSPGYFGRLVPGLELADEGVTHIERILQFWEDAGWLDDPRAVGPSNWYAYFGMPFPAEALVYYTKRFTVAGPAGAGAGASGPGYSNAVPLPMDADGAVLENHTTLFDGVLHRQGAWCVALSGQLSDVPKDALFIYRLERQNRVALWHERASVVVGGGHNLITAKHPLYNAWIDSGYGGDGDETYAGMDNGEAGSMAMALRRAKYYARAAATGVDGDVSWLELTFAHATVRFEIEPSGNEAHIRYQFEQRGVRELRLALQLVLWRGATCRVDGAELDGPHEQQEPSTVDVARQVAVDCPLFGTRAALTVPTDGAARVRFPLWPIRSYGPLFPPEKEHFRSYFAMAQVETVFTRPERRGRGEWRLRIDEQQPR